MERKHKFLELYRICIDENGKPKKCGRENTKKLIDAASRVDGGTYGDIETGFMDVDKLVQLYDSIMNT